MSTPKNTTAPTRSSCGEPDPPNPGHRTNGFGGVDVSWCRYRVEALPGRDRSGVRLRHPETGEVVAVIEGIGAGWAVQIHPSGQKLGAAGPDEDLGEAVRRAEEAIAEMAEDEAIDFAADMLNSDPLCSNGGGPDPLNLHILGCDDEPAEDEQDQERWDRIDGDRADLRRHIDAALTAVYRAEGVHTKLVDAYDIEYDPAGFRADFASFLTDARRALRAAQALNPVKDGA